MCRSCLFAGLHACTPSANMIDAAPHLGVQECQRCGCRWKRMGTQLKLSFRSNAAVFRPRRAAGGVSGSARCVGAVHPATALDAILPPSVHCPRRLVAAPLQHCNIATPNLPPSTAPPATRTCTFTPPLPLPCVWLRMRQARTAGKDAESWFTEYLNKKEVDPDKSSKPAARYALARSISTGAYTPPHQRERERERELALRRCLCPLETALLQMPVDADVSTLMMDRRAL